MNIKFMMMFVAAVYAWNVQAQDLDASLHEPSAQPIPLIEDDVFEEGVDLEAFDPTISYYVQNLNLSPDQLAKARQISESGQAKRDELLQQIEVLRREAYALEAGSLIAFEAILNEEQRAAFHELRAVTQNDAEDSAINEDTEFDEE